MLKKIFKVTIKNIFRYNNISLIKILGLTIGLTCLSVIYIYISSELGFDTFHKKYENIYRLLTIENSNGETTVDQPAIILPNLKREYPEIKNGIRIYNWGKSSVSYQDKKLLEKKVLLSDADFFNLFDFTLIKGTNENVLKDPFSMVITESMAKKYFGNDNPVGKMLFFDNEFNFTVTGVVKDIPSNSHLQFNFLGSLSSLETIEKKILTEWNYSYSYIYVELKKNTSIEKLESKFDSFLQKNLGKRIASLITLKLEPLSDVHLKSVDTRNDIAVKGNIKFIYAFTSIAIIILIIACFNFTTLTLANVRLRAKEIGIRKVNGASMADIFFQFLFETFVYTSFSFALSLLLTIFVLPFLNVYLGKNLALELSVIIKLLVITLITVPFFAGGYPSLILSKLKPILIIKGDIDGQPLTKLHKKAGKINIRNLIVLIQIAFALIVLISTIMIYKQLKYIKHVNLGFDKENVIVVNNPYDKQMDERFNTFKQMVLTNSNIESVSAAYDIPPSGISSFLMIRHEGMPEDENKQIAVVAVKPGFFNTLKSNLKLGTDFSKLKNEDEIEEIVINESLMKELNLSKPLGEKLLGLSKENSSEIIGVVNDINFSSLREKIEPMIFYVRPWASSTILIRTKTNNPNTIKILSNYWQQIAPEHLFQYSFLSSNIDNCYTQEYKAALLFSIFTILTIFLSIFGLIGLISYTIESSIKEIVIRKIFGATIINVNIIFYKKIMGIVIIAIIISCPLAYYIIKTWLQEFTYKTPLTLTPFILTSIIISLIILCCITFQVVRGNKLNIIKVLKQD